MRWMKIAAAVCLSICLLAGTMSAPGESHYEALYNMLFEAEKYEAAIPSIMKAAEGGYAPAQNLLGDCYFNGMGVEIDYNAALKW
jgi:TPR repeat protein